MKIKLLCFFSLLLPLLLNANVTIGKWRVFFAPKDKLTAEQVCDASRNGILPAGAVEFTLKNNLRNLKDIRGYYHFGKEAALVHTTITARKKCKVRIGTGCDWFMSVFCNGKMVMSNEPDGSTVYTSHTEMDYQLTLDLNAGTNHLSFRLRPGSASWDFAFALAPSPANWPKETDGRRGFFQRLFPDAERTFYIFPYISDITPDSVRLSMEFSDEEAVQLRYRKMGSNKWLLHAPELREGLISRKKLHHFELKNLAPASRYECIIEVLAQKYGAKPVEIQRCVFNTLPDRGMKHSVIITGDTQVRPYICREAVIATCKTAPDAAMFIHLGDVQHSIKNPVRDFFRNIVDAVNVNYAEKIKNNPETPLLPAILLRGNHEDLLLDLLYSGKLLHHHFLNGTMNTVENFFGKYAAKPDGTIDFSGKTRIVDRLCEFIEETVDYFETGNYVFVHGWFPLIGDTLQGRKDVSKELWKKARWEGWHQHYENKAPLPDKTLICGHIPTSYASRFDLNRAPSDYGVFHGNGLIALDACTAVSGKINVLVLQDELV